MIGAGHLHGFGIGDIADDPGFSTVPGHTIDAHVDDVAPGLIQSPRTISGRPIAAIEQIGAAADRGKIVRPANE